MYIFGINFLLVVDKLDSIINSASVKVKPGRGY